MYSTYHEGKSVAAERFIRTLKNKLFKHMTAISENIYFDLLDDIVNKYNNTVHITIKMKPIEVTGDSYVRYDENRNKKDPKLKGGDYVRISKYKNIFAKGYTPNWSEKVFAINKIKNAIPWTYSTALRCGSFSEKISKKRHLRHHDQNYFYFCKSNIPLINLIVDSRNMVKLSKNISF